LNNEEKQKLINKKEEEVEWWRKVTDESAGHKTHGFTELFIH
jgi:hypothetical protein